MKKDWVVHPGELVLDELQERKMSQTDLAVESGWTLKHINQVIKGHVPISIDFALMLEELWGVDARVWLNMQLDYDLGVARGLKVV